MQQVLEEEDFELPLAKRLRIENGTRESPRKIQRGSRLYTPFRTIGLVSPSCVPFTSVPLGKTTFQITTNVGRQVQTYDLRKGLSLVFLSSPQTPQTITAICAYKDRVFVAWGGEQKSQGQGIWIFRRGRLVEKVEVPEEPQEIRQLHVMGVWLIGAGTHSIEVWKSRASSYEHYTSLKPTRSGGRPDAEILSALACAMPTYLNKILVARLDGIVEIWNVSTGRCVHAMSPPRADSGAITALQPTPALSCVAIAHADGSLVVHDIERDQRILSFRQSSLPISTITFRTDGTGAGEEGREDGVMATASKHSGDITLWDLNDGGRITGILRAAHETTAKRDSGIAKIEFLPSQAVLVSTGLDNALRTWIFDQNPFSPVPRILHARSGHAGPITTLNFVPASSDGSEAASKWLLSASQGRDLWGFSLRRDGQSSELSQGNVKHKAKKRGHLHNISSTIEGLKAPPIAMIACSLNRDGGMGAVGGPIWQEPKNSNAQDSSITGWESVVTGHENDNVARTWFWGRKRAGRWTLRTGDNKPVSSIAMSACGTFAVIGSTGGGIDMYNLQSGIHRQRFPPKINKKQAQEARLRKLQADEDVDLRRGHRGSVTGVMIDALNQNVLSCSLDGSIRFWELATGLERHKHFFDSCAPTALQYNSTSGLVSIACDDHCIRIFDIETKRIVRELQGCGGQIYDHRFSHDGRWIISCSKDSVIRTFDLATGHLIDAFKTATCIGLTFSSTGEYLATAHSGSFGINIWHNTTLFRHVPHRQIDERAGIVDLSDSAIFDETNMLAIEESIEDAPAPVTDTAEEIEQLNADLLTLSLVPRSRWQSLLHLDEIRARNKPIEPPKAPVKAPFFLSSALSTTSQQRSTDGTTSNGSATPAERSRIIKLQQASGNSGSIFSQLLADFSKSVDHEHDPSAIISHLSSLSPSQMDLEIRCLTPSSEMVPFVDALTFRLQQKRDFELVNSFMACFLRVHGEDVLEDSAAKGRGEGESESGGAGAGAGTATELRAALRRWDQTLRAEEERLGQLVGYCKGVIAFLRRSR